MTTIPCTQPGCTGRIVDGYCDICGSPDAAASAATPATSVTPASSATPSGSAASSASAAPPPAVIASPPSLPSQPSSRSAVSRASNRLASAPLGSARASIAGSKLTRKLGTASSRLRGARLGAGLTHIPSIAPLDASKAVLTDPSVPEHRRVCPSCGNPVGRSRDGRPGRTTGFCPQCRNPFSFAPALAPGELVGGQYAVAGAFAHGGFGWLYLARDKNVSDRWVVLKGLLNAGDADAVAAAIAEQQFLARVEHPLIVEIYNFVTHDDAGYIVMEYVGGTSLKTLLKDRTAAAGGRYDPLPVDQAIAYVLEVLPAFSYLHDLGLAYCDFKPDNLIQVGDAVKLIDLGGVRRIDDADSAIYGTVGYQAPEVAEAGVSVASDIYTLGRTLAVLTMEFRGYSSTYASSFPPVEDTPLFREYDSFYRLLSKACAPDPADRFASVDELRVQLLGVLREVVAVGSRGAALHSTSSLLFGSPSGATAAVPDWQRLPPLREDDRDPQAGWLSTVSVTEPRERLRALRAAPEASPEALLQSAIAAVGAGDYLAAETSTGQLLQEDPWEWRALWVQGLSALAQGRADLARSAFNAVYGQVPGELAPKLALAMACESSGEDAVAEGLYLTCVRTDATYIAPAALGLTRIRLRRGDLDDAVSALDLVPPTSGAYVAARQQRAHLLADSGRGLPALAEAMVSIDQLTIDPVDRASLSATVYRTALAQVQQHGPRADVKIGGRSALEPDLRDGLEQAYRDLAAHQPTRESRIPLIDQANDVRRWTLR